MDPYTTVTKKDYVPKQLHKLEKYRTEQEFKDPLREGFKTYLQLSTAETPPKPPSEDADLYLDKIKELYPKVGKMYYETPINNKVMEKSFIYNGRTVYQIDYCDLVKDQEYKAEMLRKNAYRLPDDWYVPLTTQKASYRIPTMLNKKAMERPKQIRAQNNLDPEEHIREILNVTTGYTELEGVIGKLGTIIMDDELHGKIIHQPCSCTEHHPKTDE